MIRILLLLVIACDGSKGLICDGTAEPPFWQQGSDLHPHVSRIAGRPRVRTTRKKKRFKGKARCWGSRRCRSR